MDGAATGIKVLVLEDEAIIAMDVEATLTEAGLEVAATLASCADALSWLDKHIVHVALLDMHLLDGSCEPVAQRLAEMAIPFVVFSGDAATDANVHPIFARAHWLEKPAPSSRIVETILTVMRSKDATLPLVESQVARANRPPGDKDDHQQNGA